ncbi:MAG: hypothetical protein ACO4AH_05725, partial [Burkholderiaceae bacterium]
GAPGAAAADESPFDRAQSATPGATTDRIIVSTVNARVSDLTVLSYSEIPDDQSVKVVHTVEAKPKD